MAPPRHLKLTLPRPPPSSYTASTSASSSSSSSALDCDVPVPSIEHVDAADRIDRTANWVVQSSGSRAGSPTPPPRLSGSPAFTETSAPERESSASRSPSLSDDIGIPRPSPSASPIRAASNSDGEREIKREPTEGSIWSASPRLPPARRSSVSGPCEPAPSQSPSVSGSGVLCPASKGSKRSRDAEDDGAGERSSQRRCRSTSPGFGSRLPSASLPGDTGNPAPLLCPSAPGFRVLGSTSSGCKRSRDVEDVGAGDRSPQRRRTGSTLAADPASASGSRVLYPASPGSRRSRVVEVARPSFLEVVLATPERPSFLDVVLATPVPAAAASPAAAVAVPVAAVANPGPLPDRAEVRLQARLDALFAKSRGRPRAERSALVSSHPPLPPSATSATFF
ncbi:hypothetical protein VF21_00449 [Pseudogymnoascus sp. 05NY08]|nr:hypothetical protein VF21_00449 [Pseudogymnoascus sp. 05NY08]